MKSARLATLVTLACAATLGAQSAEPVDYDAVSRIRQEALGRSQVMDHLSWLSDVYGPRMTGTPALAQASDIDLVVWPESVGLFAALTGPRAEPARESDSLEGSIVTLAGVYA